MLNWMVGKNKLSFAGSQNCVHFQFFLTIQIFQMNVFYGFCLVRFFVWLLLLPLFALTSIGRYC